ncbi:proline-rich protein 12 isoform X1 [Phyllopteryx taeniolatus]|uniref:proline-rich protein 12 isoform X1 n=1 Tax=Phyllopteryx taeniolatus TaxID=161469 RepID=UPI002AD3C371|nr:proline-rich protein 12 isoform X1 [Phyllopteryx taeniolatus]
MERNYPAAGFGDLGSGTGWSYDRSAKASLMYGSARSSHTDSELLHRQAYGTPHPLQGYATNHHPGGSRQGGAWGGRTLGLSGLFDASLHHSGPSGPDPSVMNLISALDSRGPQPPPSASSLLTQFRPPSWQSAMHTPAPTELFISGALPGSSSFPSSSALSAYQHPGSFSGHSFTPSLSLQDTPTFSPTSNGLLSPHDPLLHIKTPSQSSLGFDRLLSSQSSAYRSSQELPPPPQNHAPPTSSSCHLPPPQFNLLSSQLHNQSSQLYNASMFSSTPALIPTTPPQSLPSQERAIPRQDTVIKHYQRSSPVNSTTLSLQQYINCGGSVGYQQIPSQHRHAGVSCSPLGEQSPPSDPKPIPQSESQTYRPNIQTPYTSSSSTSASSSSGTKETKSSTCGYSSSNSASSSSRTSHTPPSASSNSSSSSSNPKASTGTLSAPSRQQPPPQSAPVPPPLPVVSSAQSTPKPCLSTYGSPPGAKSSTSLPGLTPPQQQAQSYSPHQPASTHMTQSCGGFSSPNTRDINSGSRGNGGKAFTDLGSGGRSFSAEIVFEDSNFSSASQRRAESPSLGYGNTAGSTGSGSSGVATLDTGLGSAGSGSGVASVGSGGSSSYHLNESSPSPSVSSTAVHSGLHSPASVRPAQSPGGSGASKYHNTSMLSPTFIASSQGFTETRQPSYHSTPPKPKTQTKTLGIEHSQEEEEDDDFLIQQLLRTQSSTSHSAQHHQSSLQIPQQLPLTEDKEAKVVTYDMNKISEERYHLHSVIRTNSTTSSSDPETSISEVTSGLNSQLEISQKKQQQTKTELTMSKSTSEGVGGVTDSLSHTNHSHQSEHDSLVSVGHYGRGDPYTQHPHSQHSHHIAHLSPHSQQQCQQSQLSQHTQPSHHSQQNNPHPQHPHMELKKSSDRTDSSYLCNTTDVQQARQNQVSHQMMNSPPDCPQQTQMLHSVMSRTKMDAQQAPQQHPLSQQGIMGSSRGAGLTGVDSHTQSQSSQLELQLQNQSLDTHYSLGAPRDQSQISQNSVSTLDMLDQPLSQPRRRDSGGALDRHGIRIGANITEGDCVVGERHRQQHNLSSHHHPQRTAPELHGFLSEPDMGLPTTSHLHHVNQSQSHAHHQQRAHSHHQLSHSHLAHPQSQEMMAGNIGTPQQLQQSQPRETEKHLSHTQLDRLKPHQFDTVSPGGKTRLHQNQQQEHFTSLTSICFSDSLLNDEDRSFFPGMDDIFCSANYKSSCVRDSATGQAAQENITQGRRQEGMDILKSGGAGQRYGLVSHHGDQGYEQYCHSFSASGNTNLNLDIDSMKTHDLPSTVNTDQLGLIQSQTPAMGLNPAPQDSVNKMTGSVGVGGGSSSTGMTSAIFCSSRPKKLLKTSSFHLLKQRREPQPLTKKNYAQEYEFEDDEEKDDGPADIRLNSRRLPDLIPDLVSSCRKSSVASGVSGLSPLMGDMDFCYSSLGHSQPLLPQDGPKKRGRKPTKPKREGPPRPRGRPRIRPLPEPSYCRGLMGSAAGESKRGRGRGRGRGKREEGLMESHQDVNKAHNLPYQQQQQQQQQQHVSQPQHLQQHPHEHHRQRLDQHQISQQEQGHLLHHHVPSSHHQMHHQQQQHDYQRHMQIPAQHLQQDSGSPIKVTLPVSAMPPSESLLRTDSLSSTDPALSDGSLVSAPSLGPSPGPSTNMDINRNELNQTQDKMHHEYSGEITWKKEIEEPLNPEGWGPMQKLSSSVDEKAFDFKPGFMSSFLDFLKTGKKQSGLELVDDGSEQEAMDTCSSLKGGIRPITPTPPLSPTQPQQLPGTFSQEREGEGTLSSCPSPCKPLDDELKGNLEALPSFSSDEEDSVSKNQDLQKSISSAISALYDTPHSLAAAMASAMVNVPSSLSPPTPQEPPLSPLPPAMPPLVPSTTMANGKVGMLTYNQLHAPDENNFVSSQTNGEQEEQSQSESRGEHKEEEEGGGGETAPEEEMKRDPHDSQQTALDELEVKKEDRMSERQRSEVSKDSPSSPVLAPAPLSASPSVSPSPPTYSSSSPLPPVCLSVSVNSLQSIQREEEVDPPYPLCKQQQASYQAAPTAGTSPPPSTSPPAIPSPPLSNLPQSHSIPPPSTTPPPSCSDQDQEPEAGQASPSSPSSSSPSASSSPPPSPPTPEEAPASQRLTALHLAKKQADAAIAGESEEEDSESGGEGIFRERDEFVIRTEDIGTLKMALQTGREPPPIWRVQKALLQKFSPEIKDGQRQFCATSNYLGYFGDAKMRYQRLYVKFLENVNKKDYVRVCSRKPWHRTGLTLRRQSLPKQLPTLHNQTPPRLERDDRDKDRPKEKELKEKKEREQREKAEKEQKERERKEKVERDKKEEEHEREQRARDRKEKENAEKEEKNQRWDRDQRERKTKEKTVLLKSESERRNKEMRESEREQKERDKRCRELKEREEQDRVCKGRERQESERKENEKQGKDRVKEKERLGPETGVTERGRHKEKQKELGKDTGARDVLEVRRGTGQCVKEEKRGVEKKMVRHSRGKMTMDKTEPPPKKRKQWMKELPSSSSESDSSLPSEDEGPLRVGMNSRAMREMFRSYVEMLVSTALDPDMIQALEDTDDELYLPPMRKIDSLLNEQKKRLLRRVTMSAQHQEALHIFPKMTADPLESGTVKVRLGGEGYNRKTLNRGKRSIPKQQDLKLSIETCRIYSLYHSLHHYKYHTFLHCKKETDSIEQAADDPGQEEVVQQCMANQSWLESLFNSFMELLSLSGKA